MGCYLLFFKFHNEIFTIFNCNYFRNLPAALLSYIQYFMTFDSTNPSYIFTKLFNDKLKIHTGSTTKSHNHCNCKAQKKEAHFLYCTNLRDPVARCDTVKKLSSVMSSTNLICFSLIRLHCVLQMKPLDFKLFRSLKRNKITSQKK